MVVRIKEGDKAALEYLYDKYSGALFGVIKRIITKDEVAEEMLQDAFIKIWDRIGSYDPARGRLFTWMLNVARNLAIDKTRSKEISNESKTAGLENLVGRIDRKKFVEQSVDAIGLKEELSRLPDDQKLIVEYLYLKGYTQSELAEELNIPLGTVKTRLRLGMIQLRQIFQVN